MKDELRISLLGDEEELKELWRAVFEDDESSIDAFFDRLYTPGMAVVFVHDERIVSAAYVLELGQFVSEGRLDTCRLVYAFGTRPEYRSMGYGGRVLRFASELAAKDGVAVLCPAERSLFAHYEKFGYRTHFNMSTQSGADIGVAVHGSVTRASLRGYAALREELLSGREHIDFDLKALAYQEHLCVSTGGGLFYVVSDGVRCAAAVEVHDGRAVFRELIVPSGTVYTAAMLVCRALKAREFTYRAPVRPGGEAQPFAMIQGEAPAHVPDTGLAWLGFAFD